MRLAIFWPAQVFRTGNQVLTHGFAHQWFTPLARHFSGVELIARGSDVQTGSIVIDTDRIDVTCLPAVSSAARMYTVKFPSMVLSIVRLVRARRRTWDRILVYEAGPLAQIVYWSSKLAGLPVLLYLGGRHEEAVVLRSEGEGRLRNAFAQIWSRWCKFAIPQMIRRAPTIVTGSELARHYQSANRQGLYTIISSSVKHATVATDTAERRRGSGDRVPVILTVCTLSPVKGVEYLIRASASLLHQGRDIRLRIVGPSRNNYHEQLRALARDLGITDAVEFTGAISPGPDLQAAYDDADVFVLPSLSEGTPKVILEAMSRGVPVLSTNVGAIGDLIQHERTGLLVEPRRPDLIASALERMLDDDEIRGLIAKNGLDFARGMTVEAQTERLAQIIIDVPVRSRNVSAPTGGEDEHVGRHAAR